MAKMRFTIVSLGDENGTIAIRPRVKAEGVEWSRILARILVDT